LCNNKRILKNGTKFGKGIGNIECNYQERIVEEMLPFRTVVVGASIPTIKMEKPLEDQEVDATYWYHS
jgi:hypothetical protein